MTLAFVAALLSLAAAALGFLNRGEINVTPLVGGVFMLALGIIGYRQLRNPPPPRQ